jgi:hypothetical protein
VKKPEVITAMWNRDNSSKFYDFSPVRSISHCYCITERYLILNQVLTHDGFKGWKYVLERFEDNEKKRLPSRYETAAEALEWYWAQVENDRKLDENSYHSHKSDRRDMDTDSSDNGREEYGL